jgi:NADPH:quinone reductase-like Zn-dependent oxidoreductase
MKTAVNRNYNTLNDISLEERNLGELKADEIEIRVHAASLNKADLLLAKGKPSMIRLMYGFKKPKNIYPGTDFSGEVLKVGSQTSQFNIGDKVYGDLSGAGFGALSEIIHTKEKNIWLMPKGYSYLDAAAMPMPMGTALEAIKKVKTLANKKVLIYGATGGVGRYLVQLAKISGADVDAVASKKHLDDLKHLGVSENYDYQSNSFSLPKDYYDAIFAVNGYQPLRVYGKSLVKDGSCVIIGGDGKQLLAAMIKGWFYRIFKKRNIYSVLAKPGQDVLKEITTMCEKSKIDVQIGKIYSFNEISQAYIDFDNHVYTGKYVIEIKK